MGPLYHLTEAAEREQALLEARRVLRPGGLLVAAAIGRHAALLDMLVRLDLAHEPGVWICVEESVRTGVFRGYEHGLFTTAYFHLPEQLRDELAAAGFELGRAVQRRGARLRRRRPRLTVAQSRAARGAAQSRPPIESEPSMLASASHLLAIARTPGAEGQPA